MQELFRQIPDVDALLSMGPERLGIRILLILKAKESASSGVRGRATDLPRISMRNLLTEFSGDPMFCSAPYPNERMAEVGLAASEALNWLTGQGYLVPHPRQTEWHTVSRNALAVTEEQEAFHASLAAMLPRAMLQPELSDRPWFSFMRGEFATAVSEAMRQAEKFVYHAAYAERSDLGVKEMRTACHQDTGVLTERADEPGDLEALMHFYTCAIGFYKDRSSHQDVPFDDPAEVVDILLLANDLIRIAKARAARADGAEA